MSSAIAQRTQSRGELREAILAASERIGSELGQVALTMRNIAAAVGVSPTILYQHFDNKAAILRELVAQGHAELDAELDLAISDSTVPHERLRALCSAYFEFARRNPWMYSLLYSMEGGEEGARERVAAFVAKAARCLVDVRVRPTLDPTTAGLHAWIAMHGLVQATLEGGPLAVEPSFVDAFIVSVVAGVGD